MVELPYGRVPYPLDLGDRHAIVVVPPALSDPADLTDLLDSALDAPIGRPRVEDMVSAGARVTIVISDSTRLEPRAALLDAVHQRLAGIQWTVAVATGTHGPARIDELGIPLHLLRDARMVNHDGHRVDDLVTLGTTRHGTQMRVHRCVVEADLVIATGCIRPHYFAGFGAGVKSIFPGLGAAAAIRHNHKLKTEMRSRAGIVDGNPCRGDLEEAFGFLETPTFLLNGVFAADGQIHAAVAGDPIAAFRAGSERARPWFTAWAPRAPVVIASDVPPVTATLYQAAKIAAAVAPLVRENGRLVLVAECADGIGPLDIVNESIFRIGVLPRLAPNVAVHLVSGLPSELVSRTLVHPARSVAELLGDVTDQVVVVPRASQLILETTS